MSSSSFGVTLEVISGQLGKRGKDGRFFFCPLPLTLVCKRDSEERGTLQHGKCEGTTKKISFVREEEGGIERERDR